MILGLALTTSKRFGQRFNQRAAPAKYAGIGLIFTGLVFVLTACGTKQQAPRQEAGPAEESSREAKTTNGYAVEMLPAGAVEGKALLAGKAGPPKKLRADQDRDICADREIYPVRVEDGGIVDAVVWIDDVSRGKAFEFPKPVLDQKHCTFEPHIVVMQPGELKVRSSDPVSHNVHTDAQFNRNYNQSMSPIARELSLQLTRPERFNVRCDLHRWMSAYVVVAANPYYTVTSRGGNFQLDKVPVGRYHIKVWQETLGELEQQVTVQAGKTTELDFTFRVF
ncbi:MAG: carboxypeptidase regulatory-like domain-containing protein [Acidobacteria bacterium]|nr:carboxypeptidase regulatory-like domain-containing protein [Acidobacteriota bacterium]